MSSPLPPSRFRRVAKRVGVVVCVVVFAMWAVSLRVSVGYGCRAGQIGVGEGCAGVVWTNREWFDEYHQRSGSRLGWFVTTHDFTQKEADMFAVEDRQGGAMVGIITPLWIPLILAAIPAAILWYRDRRTVEPGHCVKCGYDLRASKKVCPECGAAIEAEPL